jgi:hypothetical protein
MTWIFGVNFLQNLMVFADAMRIRLLPNEPTRATAGRRDGAFLPNEAPSINMGFEKRSHREPAAVFAKRSQRGPYA